MTEDFRVVQRLDFIREQCAGRTVLHLGCTNWPYTEDAIRNNMLLHFELAETAAELYGVDFDRRGIEILEEHGSSNLFQADLERLDELDLDRTFDVVVAGEMIEHLNNPGLFLDGIKRFMRPDSILLLTTINAYCGMRFAYYGLRGKRGRAEPVHPDHVAYYSYSTLKLLIERHQMRIDQFLFYDIGNEHRPLNRRILNIINDICVWIAPQWADGLIAVCRVK